MKSFIVLIILTGAMYAKEVPKKLFEIELGKVYDMSKIPVKKVTGVQKFLGFGTHYFFQPKKEYSAFKYEEIKVNPSDEYFKSSFRLYLLPIYPKEFDINKIKQSDIKWEVSVIEWSESEGDALRKRNEDKTRAENAYYWAIDICKTFKNDLGLEPKIIDFPDDHWYLCEFTQDNRLFKVSSSLKSKSMSLEYTKEYHDKRNDEIDKFIRKKQAETIRPY